MFDKIFSVSGSRLVLSVIQLKPFNVNTDKKDATYNVKLLGQRYTTHTKQMITNIFYYKELSGTI